MDACLELRCRIPRQRFGHLEAVLEDLGALAITLAEGDTEVFGEPGVAGGPAWSWFDVRALFDADIPANLLLARVHLACGTDFELTAAPIRQRDWAAGWKDQWQARMFANGLCVCPTWCEPPAQARALVRLDPGQAFGTGTHETTALCLDWLASEPALEGRTVLDYGCGSGVLAIAAARLGAAAVWAVDVDPAAIAVAEQNVALNNLQGVVRVGAPEVAGEARADVLVANILLAPLLSLEPRFAELLVCGSRLALSGLLAQQVPRVLDAYHGRFTMDEPVLRGEWALVAGRRR